MSDFWGYFFLVDLIILGCIGVRAWYWSIKLISYIQKNYPEKAEEYGCPIGRCFNTFSLNRGIHKIEETDDQKLDYLRRKVKSGTTLAIIAILPFLLALLFILILLFLSFLAGY